ncbi:glycosyltransferase family 4 protein [Falsiroseomonas oryzae]|uniref:glycosyltransferase family 4 protein n=1 Tax=Falsiroseomonas oryzae TaxID=2766473 RepID=UPI0022EA998B|nr:glycosyltransferase family 4 protein [Roseomonas sp. MO-31]
MTPRRILFATQTFPPDLGGMEGLMGGLATALARHGLAVEVFADRIRSDRPELTDALFALRRFGGPRPLRRWLKRRVVAASLRAGPPAALVADSWKSVEALPRVAAPLLVLAHGMEFPPEPSARKAARIRAALARATGVAANSRYTLDRLRPYLPAATRCDVIAPPIDPQPEPAEAALRAVQAVVAGDGPVLLTLSRLEPRKGVDQVIRALPGLAARHPGVLHLVAGGGPDLGRLEALAGSLGVTDRVRFLGRVDETTKAALFRCADLFAMPVRREGASVEGFGIAYLEAAWHGLPALAGREGGAAEAVAAGETGDICDGADLASVEAALARLLADPDVLRGMGRRAAARVRAEFLWPQAVPRYLALLEA